MKEIFYCIMEYIKIWGKEIFLLHQQKLAQKLSNGIKDSYENNEPNIVRAIETIINEIGEFSTKNGKINISTNSTFIHGNKSYVEFEYYGKTTKRELGDIIFILSIIYNRRKKFEKMTINQIKKSKKTSWNFNNESSREQLYLLSRFPTFKGTNRSLIPNKEYNLANISGCLGSHGLLYPPGDFALISSKELETLLEKNSLKLNNLVGKSIFNTLNCCLPYVFVADYYHPLEVRNFFYECRELLKFYYHNYRFIPYARNLPILSTNCIAYNVHDFSNKYLLGYIGELIYASKLPHNDSAYNFLQELLNSIKLKAERENAKNILEFINSFYLYKYNGKDYKITNSENYTEHKGGNLGIIHTTVNLGEGKYLD